MDRPGRQGSKRAAFSWRSTAIGSTIRRVLWVEILDFFGLYMSLLVTGRPQMGSDIHKTNMREETPPKTRPKWPEERRLTLLALFAN